MVALRDSERKANEKEFTFNNFSGHATLCDSRDSIDHRGTITARAGDDPGDLFNYSFSWQKFNLGFPF
jgi:hypothetical protein